MKRIALIFILLLLSFIHCYSQEDLYDKIENALIELHFNNNIDGVQKLYPSLVSECKNEKNDTILNYLQSITGALLFIEEKYDDAIPVLEKEIEWKENNALTRYHYLEDVYLLAQCYLIKERITDAEKILRYAIVNWTDESQLTMVASSSVSIEGMLDELKALFFLAGYYITDIFQTLAQVYIMTEQYSMVPYCYFEAQNNASKLYSKDDDRFYENILLFIKSNIELGNYSLAKSHLIDYHIIPEELESRESMRQLQEELQKYSDD